MKAEVYELISSLKSKGIIVQEFDDKLKLKGKTSSLTSTDKDLIYSLKSEILEFCKQKSQYLQNGSQILPVKPQKSYAVSSSQFRLWTLNQFEESSGAYNMPSQISLKGYYDIDSFKRAILKTIDRHEILRTVFTTDEQGEVRQIVLRRDELDFKIKYIDFSKELNPSSRAMSYVEEDSYKPFNLENGPLFRVSLIKLAHDEYVFYYNMHHIISDGWSMGVLIKDVSTFYKAFVDNIIPNLPPLKIQYKDYAAWQRNQMGKSEFLKHKNYWLQLFSNDIQTIDLPTQKRRPKFKTYRGKELISNITPNLTNDLNNYVNDKGGSLYIALLTLWNILIYKYTSVNDIIIGCPVSGREHSDLADQIGFYLNTLALRNQINDEESFNEVYKKIKETTLNSYEHQAYPFDQLVEDLSFKWDSKRSAIFDIMLLLQDNQGNIEKIQYDESEIDDIKINENTISKFDLEITFREKENLLGFSINYNADVYERNMIERLIGHFKRLLTIVLKDPDVEIRNIDFILPDEKEMLLSIFNDTKVAYDRNKTIVDLFEEQVYRTPEAIALVFEDVKLSYRELNAFSNQLAYYLKEEYTIVPDDLVGIKLERSEYIIIAILGILKSGGAYVPIDPEYPQDRIDYILSDTNCKALIDSRGLEDFKSKCHNFSKVDLDSKPLPNDLAYVIYTSGSTGKPKGVMIEHKSQVSFINGVADKLEYIKAKNVASTTNMVFDIFTLEIFESLCKGRRIILFDRELFLDKKLFLDKMNSNEVDVLQLTPSKLRIIEEDVFENKIKTLKTLIVGGEAFSKSAFEKIGLLNSKIINVYGPTETTVWSTFSILDKDSNLSIGVPFHNENVYILNHNNDLLPLGCVGEICIGGDGLARGYLNSPKLTQEKFIKHPFKQNQRLYKTGDLGKWLPNGTIEFVGRKDDQVKINGHRIELKEIEHQLRSIDDITEAVVLVNNKENGEKELIAYLVSKVNFTSSDIRTYLLSKLPDYMIPVNYILLDSLPLTPSGKVDKKSLPVIEGKALSSGILYVKPRTKKEEILVQVCEEILDKNPIGVKDDVFNLGVTSIKILQIITKLKGSGYILDIREIYDKPVIEELAKVLRSNNNTKTLVTPSVFDKSMEIGDVINLSPNQYRFFKNDKSSITFNAVVNKIQTEKFENSFKNFISMFPFLCVKYEKREDKIVQKRISIEDLNLEIFIEKDFQSAEEKIKEYQNKSFDLFNGALIRVLLIPIDSVSSNVTLAIHHSLIDDFSSRVINSSLISFFNEDKVEIDYTAHFEFIRWQNDFLLSEQGKIERKYWKNLLKDNIVNFSNNETVETNSFISYEKIITGSAFDQIKKLSSKNSLPVNAFFLAIHQWLIAELNYDNFGIQGVAVNGREQLFNHSSIDKILGVLDNILPLPLIKGKDSFGIDFVKNVYLNYLEARTHQQIPYEVIRKDFEDGYNIDIEKHTSGIFNFREFEDSIINISDKENEIRIWEENLESMHQSVNMLCLLYPNALKLKLQYAKPVYQNNREKQLSIDFLINKILSF